MSFLIQNGYVVTMNTEREVFDGGFVAVSDGKIEAVGPVSALPEKPYDETLDASRMIVLPGLINMHQHHWYNLFKGLCDGMLLEPWVFNFVLPVVERLTAEDLRASAYLAALEMVRTGTTCCLNHSITTTMAEETAATIEPMAEIGFRQVFAKDFRCKTPGNPDHPHTVQEAEQFIGELVDKWHGAQDGLIRMAFVIESNAHWVAAGMSSGELIKAGYELAKEKDLKISAHIAGGTLSMEMGYLKYLRETGRTDVAYLMEGGFLDERWLLIHGIHISDTDIAMMKEAGSPLVYTPTSESIRGGGIVPAAKACQAGVNVALGTDGPMVDYSVDMVEQMKACTLMQHVRHLDPTVMPIERSVEMATLNGAKALGMEEEIGSLEPGKRADVSVFDMSGPHVQVVHKPLSNFVCCGRGADAHTVLIDGKAVLREGRFTAFSDVDAVVREATERGRAIAEKTGHLDRAKLNWPGGGKTE